MYTNSYYDYTHNMIYIFDDENGIIDLKYQPYCWKEVDKPTENKTIYGKYVEKHIVTESAKNSSYYHETDISPELRVLVDEYYNIDEQPKNRTMVLDIEVSSKGGFPNVETANKFITSIATRMLNEERYIVFVCDKKKKFTSQSTKNKIYIVCSNEKVLLKKFMNYYIKINPTILVGWNSYAFDIPYLYRRMKRVFNVKFANQLSPINIVKEMSIVFSLKNEIYDGYKIAGVSQLDYMILYKKYSINDKPMYKLGFIGEEELDKGKVEYDGSLDNLYETNINKYVEYNIVDVEIICELEDKLHYIEIAVGMCHKGCIPYDSVFHQSKIIEGAILVYFKHNNLVGIDKGDFDREHFAGAYVKEPHVGRHSWVYSCDLTSLYPSIIRTLNISPETKFGKIINVNNLSGDVTLELANGDVKEISESKYKEFTIKNKIKISSSGVLYRSDKKGFIPTIIETWFNDRLEYKKLKKEGQNAGDKDKEKQYDIKQYVTKILLNSVYGVLGLSTFRFYDKDNALSVTSTGQKIIKYSEENINKAYEILGAEKEKDYMIYGDTDSVYVSASPLFDGKKITDNNMFYVTRVVANFMTELLNSKLERFAVETLNSEENYLEFNQEAICRSALWSKKKKYALYILEDEGFVKLGDDAKVISGFKMPTKIIINTLSDLRKWIESDIIWENDIGIFINEIKPKLKVKGLDTVKSDFPNYFKKILKEVLIDILEFRGKDELREKIIDFRNNIDNQSIIDIAIPKGVNNIEKYYDKNMLYKKGAPIHVKSAINYNKFLEKYNLLESYRKVVSGEKIKFVHLKNNEFNFNTIGFKDDIIPNELFNFIEKNIDKKSIFKSVLLNKLLNFWGILGWGDLVLTENKLEKFF